MTITINRLGLLEFYDQRNKWPLEVGSQISGITGLIGEDLVLGLFQHYLCTREHVNAKVPTRCKGPENRGSRLDAWVFTPTACYQTEVKNWCASAMGGISVGSSDETLLRAAKLNLARYLGHKDTAKHIWKVLKPMFRPMEHAHLPLRPLLAFWSPVALPTVKNASQLKPFFKSSAEPYQDFIKMAGVGEHAFSHVWIFSASLYLRELKQARIKVQMPRAVQRLKKLK
jgi:hypothetical protein